VNDDLSEGAVPVRVGVLGCGNVGAPLVELISTQGPTVEARTGLRLTIGSPPTRRRSSTTPTSTSSSSSSAGWSRLAS
jgi:homoserine dehydrogenase